VGVDAALALILPDDSRAAEATFYAMTGLIKFSDQMYVSPRLTSYVQITCLRDRHPIGSAVVSLIFSMANREVTFLSGTEAISRL
jgi:hypothetical protein